MRIDEQVSLMFEQYNYAGAISLLEKQLVKAFKDPHILTLLGLAHFQLGSADKAIEYALMAKKLDDSNALTNQVLGDIYFQRGNSVNAMYLYKHGLVKDSYNVGLMHKIKAAFDVNESPSYMEFFPVVGLKRYCQNGSAKLRVVDLVGKESSKSQLTATFIAELDDVHALGQNSVLFSSEFSFLVDDQDLAEVDRSDLVSVTMFRNILGFSAAQGEETVDKVLAIIPKDIIHISKCIVLSCRAADNYFHWLIEVLPKWLLIESCDAYKDFPILVNAHMPEQHYQALKKLVGGKRQIIGAEEGKHYNIEKAIVPSKLSHICFDLFPGLELKIEDACYHPAAISFLRNGFSNFKNKSGLRRKIYLTRRSSQLKTRKLLNQHEVEEFFLQQGYEMVDMAALSFEQQVAIFKSADAVAGVSGASFSNLVFSSENCRVTLIVPDGGNYQLVYENLANSVGIKCFSFVAGKVDDASKVSGHANFTVDLDEVRRSFFE